MPDRPLVSDLSVPTAPRIAVVACSVFDRELKLLSAGAAHIVEQSRFEIGLHDRPDNLRTTLQAEINRLDTRTDIVAIVLVYGLCGLGTEGLRAGNHPLVIARAHDCITHFLGSKETYAERQSKYPDTYYYTPGWNEAKRVPGPERLEALRKDLSARFDPEDVDFLLETEKSQWAERGKGVFIDLGTPGAEEDAAYTQRCVAWLNWSFEHVHGDAALLRDLLWGRWDTKRYQRVEPGETLKFSRNEEIFKAVGGCGKCGS